MAALRWALASLLFLGLPAAAFADDPSANAPAGPNGKVFNPDISANFLGLWERGTGVPNDPGLNPHNGFSLQEAELQFLADVDPYLRASILLSFSPENETTPGKTSYGVDPEEVYLETISLPSVTIRAGKFKMALGKHNQLHTHAFPFIDAPLIHRLLLGDEGLNEAGLSVAGLLPASWFSELTAQAFGTTNESLFNDASNGFASSSGQPGWLGRWKNLFDLNDDLTMELGASYASGKSGRGGRASIAEGDLTFKWRPSEGGKYHALIWSTEYLHGRHPAGVLNDPATLVPIDQLAGIASWIQYQFAERWWIQARDEYVGLPPRRDISIRRRQSALVGFFPSEFSGVRMQYDREPNGPRGKTDHTVAIQYNVTIGAHPAHSY